MGLDHNLYTYKWVKESLLEGNYPGVDAVVCKDTAMSLPKEKYDMIPSGYRHAFMIRHPNKLFKSWNKMFEGITQAGESKLPFSALLKATGATGYGLKELFDLYEYVKESGLEKNPIIIDSDDLQIDPEGVLRKFCKTAGLQYTDKLLKFDAGDGVVKQWAASKIQLQANKGVYQAAFDSTCFKKPDNMEPPPRSEFSEDLLECIDTSMPYYEKLYAERLVV
ncbi:branched-chain-amino-acid aminotransferase-like protein 1 [Anneissia japonica]|uniref:branched-chain-amino-acid aminotransferase-like protein 1 n=1 Tax=Anneissia japonica TaxID=1529436 RepID=UPI001425914E|nr:branched-chain-amino-acid aminotransferase-like protein 1 [Anneissia japonica]